MPDWPRILSDYHFTAHADQGNHLVTRPGLSIEDIAQMGERLGLTFPDEFHSLYAVYNGFGIAPDEAPDEICWLFLPLSQLPCFTEITRKGFSSSHPGIASRYFPFIDFANGDSMGYLTDVGGVNMPGLASFEHDLYQYDEDQDPDEFLSLLPVTIEEFLSLE